jgi:hypothetical protein
MPSTSGKIYYGAALVAEPGMQWEYDRPYPVDYGTTDTYTIPGSLIQTFTASGTFTPGTGVTAVDVVVIGGGGRGGNSSYSSGSPPANYFAGGGGAGGDVRVYRNVPVSGDVAVLIGGSETASSFGALTSAAGGTGSTSVGGWNNNGKGVGYGGNIYYGSAYPGYAGTLVNGTRYAGGGGAGNPSGYWGVLAGGAGGGGAGGGTTSNGSAAVDALPGTNGYGGGGGGASTSNKSPGLGGSGRVMIYEVV